MVIVVVRNKIFGIFIDKIFKDLKILIDDEVVMVEDIVKCLSFFKIIIILLCIEFVLII